MQRTLLQACTLHTHMILPYRALLALQLLRDTTVLPMLLQKLIVERTQVCFLSKVLNRPCLPRGNATVRFKSPSEAHFLIVCSAKGSLPQTCMRQ